MAFPFFVVGDALLSVSIVLRAWDGLKCSFFSALASIIDGVRTCTAQHNQNSVIVVEIVMFLTFPSSFCVFATVKKTQQRNN